MRSDASLPKHSTGELGLTVSGVSMPMRRTFSWDPSTSATIVSPSTTRTTVALAPSPGEPASPDVPLHAEPAMTAATTMARRGGPTHRAHVRCAR